MLDLDPGALRTLHWHPNADEWQYVVAGEVSVTLFGSHGRYRTEQLQKGDVGYIPQGYGHSIENVGSGAARILIGIETYNATVMDRGCNQAARILAERSDIAQTGSSDAHVVGAIGLGATLFPGHSLKQLIAALWTGTTQVWKEPEWGFPHILGSWAAGYIKSKTARRDLAFAQQASNAGGL